jgi:hypothetical protein
MPGWHASWPRGMDWHRGRPSSAPRRRRAPRHSRGGVCESRTPLVRLRWPGTMAATLEARSLGVHSAIWPCCMQISNQGCGSVAGPSTTRPSSRAKQDPCHGQRTVPASSVPADKGPPKCAQVSPRAYTCPWCRASKMGVPSTSTWRLCPSASSCAASTGVNVPGTVGNTPWRRPTRRARCAMCDPSVTPRDGRPKHPDQPNIDGRRGTLTARGVSRGDLQTIQDKGGAQAPRGRSVTTGCRGWPSQVPCRQCLRPRPSSPPAAKVRVIAGWTVSLTGSSHGWCSMAAMAVDTAMVSCGMCRVLAHSMYRHL